MQQHTKSSRRCPVRKVFLHEEDRLNGTNARFLAWSTDGHSCGICEACAAEYYCVYVWSMLTRFLLNSRTRWAFLSSTQVEMKLANTWDAKIDSFCARPQCMTIAKKCRIPKRWSTLLILRMTQYGSHCLKITQNVAFELWNFGIFHQFLSYKNWPVW